MHILCHKYDE